LAVVVAVSVVLW